MYGEPCILYWENVWKIASLVFIVENVWIIPPLDMIACKYMENTTPEIYMKWLDVWKIPPLDYHREIFGSPPPPLIGVHPNTLGQHMPERRCCMSGQMYEEYHLIDFIK